MEGYLPSFSSSFLHADHPPAFPFIKDNAMKSLRELSLNLPEQEYHDLPVWSYSVIAKYAKDGFPALATLHDRTMPTPSMEFGSLFDSIITKGKKTMDEYIVADISVPPAEKNVLDVLASHCTCTQFHDISVEEVLLTADSVKYQPKWGADARYKHISEHAKYYDTIMSGKKIVSSEDWLDAMDMYKAFRNNPYLANLFGTKDTKDVEYIYQAQFKTDWNIAGRDVEVKIMPDLLVVNHKDKTIQPVDLKTSSMPAYNFAENFLKFRYDIQAELYTDVIEKIKNENGYGDYEVLEYLFTDISRTDKVPVTYMYSPIGGLAFQKNDKVYNYKGWQELLKEILIYEEENAKVPDYITTDGPNDLIEILKR